jgi:hypothetical protein
MQTKTIKDIDNKASALNTVGELFDELKAAIQNSSTKSKMKVPAPVPEKHS